MKFPFPHFPSRKKTPKLTRRDERVFAEASELARLRLEQCIADLHIGFRRRMTHCTGSRTVAF